MQTTESYTSKLIAGLHEITKIDKRTREGKHYEDIKQLYSDTHTITLYQSGEYGPQYAHLKIKPEIVAHYVAKVKEHQNLFPSSAIKTSIVIDAYVWLYNARLEQESIVIHVDKDVEEQQGTVLEHSASLFDTYYKSLAYVEHQINAENKKRETDAEHKRLIQEALEQSLDTTTQSKLHNAYRVINKIEQKEMEPVTPSASQFELRRQIEEMQERSTKLSVMYLLQSFVKHVETSVQGTADGGLRRCTYEEACWFVITSYTRTFTNGHDNDVLKEFIDAIEWGY
jgi:hypothetical protein